MHFTTIDVVFAAVLLVFVIRCFLRGFIEEFMSKAGFVLGLLAAVLLLQPASEFVRAKFLDMNIVPEVIAFVGVFLIVFVIVKILEHMLGDIVERVNLKGFDRFLGLLLGLVEGLLVIALAIFLITIQPLFDPGPLLQDSFFASFLLPLVNAAAQAAEIA